MLVDLKLDRLVIVHREGDIVHIVGAVITLRLQIHIRSVRDLGNIVLVIEIHLIFVDVECDRHFVAALQTLAIDI